MPRENMAAHGSELVSVWKPLIVCPDTENLRRLRQLFHDLGMRDVAQASEYPPLGGLAPLAARHGANLCLIDVACNQELALPLIAEASRAIPVVALNARNDAGLILRCLRRGASEFLSEPAADSLRALLEQLERARIGSSGPRRTGRVYCVLPGKAGCGASTLAVHLAVAQGKNGLKVLLIDADPLTASIGFMLKLKSDFHIGDMVRDWKRVDEDLWGRLTANFSGVHVILAPEAPATRLEIDRRLAAEVLAYARERYDAVVVDTPDLRAADEAGWAVLADEVLLVTTNELAALHATRRTIEFLEQSLANRAHLRVIVNRYAPALGLKLEDLKTALRADAFAVLTNDYEQLQAALLDGQPAPEGSRFQASVRALIRQLTGAAPAHKSSSPFAFLRMRK